MKRFIFSFVISLIAATFAFGQTETFSDVNAEYTFDLPDSVWKMIVKPTPGSPNVEYAYGDRLDGHLEIRKLSIKEGEVLSDLVVRDHEQKLQFLPGYVQGKEEPFAGLYRGRVYNYEYVKSGKPMSGRFYYLRTNDDTVYVLRFSGMKDKLRVIRNETDSIARTFKLKSAG